MSRFVEFALSGCVWGGSLRKLHCTRFDQAKGLTRWWISTLNSSWEAGRLWRWSQAPYFSCLLPGFHKANKAAFLPDVLLSGFAASWRGKQGSQLVTNSNLLLSEPNFLLSFKWLLLGAHQGKKILTNTIWTKCWRVYLANWVVLSKYFRLLSIHFLQFWVL